MEIRQAKLHETSAVVMLVQALWPHHTTNELREELLQLLKRVDAAFFLAYHHECPVGYAHNASCAGITWRAAVPTLSGIRKKAICGACIPWAGHCPGVCLPNARNGQNHAAVLSLPVIANWTIRSACLSICRRDLPRQDESSAFARRCKNKRPIISFRIECVIKNPVGALPGGIGFR